MRVSTIIVNYNGADLLCDCLRSLEAQTRRADEVIVVDNGSRDESVRMVRERFPWVQLVEAGCNLGFAGGNNLGIGVASGEILVLLNNDTIAGPRFIEEIVAPLERDSAIAAVAGVLVFASNPDLVASAGIEVYQNGLALDHGVGDRWDTLAPSFEVFGPSAGAAAYRRSALSEVGLFADDFFLYLEDADLAWRLRLRGFRTLARRDAWALHVYSASATDGSTLKDFYLARNRAWTLIRCWPSKIWRTHWRSVLWYEIGALGYAILYRRWGSIHGRWRGWSGIRALRSQRQAIRSTSRASDEQLLYWLHTAPKLTAHHELRGRIRELGGRRSTYGDERSSVGSQRG